MFISLLDTPEKTQVEDAQKSHKSEDEESEQVEFVDDDGDNVHERHVGDNSARVVFTPIFEQANEETEEDQDLIENVSNLYFKNEGRYTGTVLKDSKLRHGHGCLRFIDGGRYEGNWSYGKAQGYGHYIFSNGDLYQGLFKDDLFEGLGKLTTKQLPIEIYDGEWHKGLREGHGTYETAQFKYTGVFHKD